ncbi:MAG TPA: ferredoxin-thioredoxin reductase catalytic domain-containing protein [Methanoregulaceae archaeon]|nr:ferredoxin-thioredoxin reductase catalytic domain-containing protein [Methanoregulaceae archaeon]
MTNIAEISDDEVDGRFHLLDREAREGGYYLNTDIAFTKGLVRGLLFNEKRFGYPSCPCRLALGNRQQDLDIICPCDYRDPDLNDYGACYCALYVSDAIARQGKVLQPVPERRPPLSVREQQKNNVPPSVLGILNYPVWRCRVCGYLCARDEPPLVCPVCKAKKDRFEKFLERGKVNPYL